MPLLERREESSSWPPPSWTTMNGFPSCESFSMSSSCFSGQTIVLRSLASASMERSMPLQ